jgi:hypothetical protein
VRGKLNFEHARHREPAPFAVYSSLDKNMLSVEGVFHNRRKQVEWPLLSRTAVSGLRYGLALFNGRLIADIEVYR